VGPRMSATLVFFVAAWTKSAPSLLYEMEHKIVLSLCSMVLRRPVKGGKKSRVEETLIICSSVVR